MSSEADKWKKYFVFNEPEKTETFILKEPRREDGTARPKEEETKKPSTSNKKKRPFLFYKFARKFKGEDNTQNKKEERKKGRSEISKKIKLNIEHMERVYSIPQNSDIVLREFELSVGDKVINAFILFYDGMTDKASINQFILQPLMLLSNMDISSNEKNTAEYIKRCLIPQNQLKEVTKYSVIIEQVNFGGCALFVDGIDVAFIADVKGREHRTVERPNTELVLLGPQEGFTETLRVNTSLIRAILKDEDLIAESITLGKRSKTPGAIMYIKNIANESLVNEVKRRLNSIESDYVFDIGQVEQLVEDNTFFFSPQTILTERPDGVAGLLAEGKVAVLLDGSPFAMVVPATLLGLIHSPEDMYVRFPYANLVRGVRTLALLLGLLLPGVYVAITNFHHEMIPTDLLLAIEAARERVPFPSVVEIFIMEIAFELIREAGTRVPGPIGPTLGIVGALILGQAAVAANIVSPIMIIIVALTAIGSFAVPSYTLSFSLRVARFGYIILGAIAGFLGITFGLFIHGLLAVSVKSFGVPMLVPWAPRTGRLVQDEIVRAPIWEQEIRPDFLNVKDRIKQPKISRKWTIQGTGDKKDGE